MSRAARAGRIARRRLAAAPFLVAATYNIHTCVGVDRRYDPARVGEVLRELRADIIALQEVEVRHRLDGRRDQESYLAEAVGLAPAPLRLGERRGRFANALLSRFPIIAARIVDLSVDPYLPRAAIDAEVMVDGRLLRVVVTHLGLRAAERREQVGRLMTALAAVPTDAEAMLMMGDLNEWRGRRGGIRTLERRLGRAPAPRTFPSWLPVLALDRIYAGGPLQLHALAVHRSPLARVASDHLPLRATIGWGA